MIAAGGAITCVTMMSTGCSGTVRAPGSPWIPRPSSIVPGATLQPGSGYSSQGSVRAVGLDWTGSQAA